MDKGAWRAAVHELTKSQTQLTNTYTHSGDKTRGHICLCTSLRKKATGVCASHTHPHGPLRFETNVSPSGCNDITIAMGPFQ